MPERASEPPSAEGQAPREPAAPARESNGDAAAGPPEPLHRHPLAALALFSLDLLVIYALAAWTYRES